MFRYIEMEGDEEEARKERQCTACFRLVERGPMLLWQQLPPGDLKNGDQLTGP